MRNTTTYILLTLLLFSSCAKEQLEVNVPQELPLFKVDMTKDGQPLLIEAGRNDFYLFTDNSLSADGEIFAPISEFAKIATCIEDCSEAFTVNINNIPTIDTDEYFGDEKFTADKFDLKADPDSAGAIVISYTSASGEVFKSSLGTQADENHFTITKMEPYQTNEKGQETVLVHADMKCIVYNDSGIPLALENGALILAVALP